MVAGTDCPWPLYSCEVASENKWTSASTSGWFTFLLQGHLYSSFLDFLIVSETISLYWRDYKNQESHLI